MNGFQTTQVSAATFESIRFANKTTVTINGNGGADTLAFNNPTTATGLTTLNVVNVGAVTQTGAVNYTNLSLNTTGPVSLTGSNDVTNLAAAVSGASSVFSFNDVDDITLTSVGGVNGISTNNGSISITTANGPVVVANTAAGADVNAGTGFALLSAGSSGATDFAAQVGASANVTGTAGVILVGDHIDLMTGATVNAGAADAVSKRIQYWDADRPRRRRCCQHHQAIRTVQMYNRTQTSPIAEYPQNPLPKFDPPLRVPDGVTLIGRPFDEGTIGRVGMAIERETKVMGERPGGF